MLKLIKCKSAIQFSYQAETIEKNNKLPCRHKRYLPSSALRANSSFGLFIFPLSVQEKSNTQLEILLFCTKWMAVVLTKSRVMRTKKNPKQTSRATRMVKFKRRFLLHTLLQAYIQAAVSCRHSFYPHAVATLVHT